MSIRIEGRRSFIIGLIAASMMLAAGCSQEVANDEDACTTNADCPNGICVDGECQSISDAGSETVLDVGADLAEDIPEDVEEEEVGQEEVVEDIEHEEPEDDTGREEITEGDLARDLVEEEPADDPPLEEEPIVIPPVEITTTVESCVVVGDSLETVTFEATGGTEERAWSLASGALPPGLSFDPELPAATAVLSGNFDTLGSYTFRIRVDSGDDHHAQTYDIRVAPVLEAPGGGDPFLEPEGTGAPVDILDGVANSYLNNDLGDPTCAHWAQPGGGRIPSGITASDCSATGTLDELYPGNYAALFQVAGECGQVMYVPVFWNNGDCVAADDIPPSLAVTGFDATAGLTHEGRVSSTERHVYERQIAVDHVDGVCNEWDCWWPDYPEGEPDGVLDSCRTMCTFGRWIIDPQDNPATTEITEPLLVYNGVRCSIGPGSPEADFCVACPDAGCYSDHDYGTGCEDWTAIFTQDIKTNDHDTIGPEGYDIGIAIYALGMRWSAPMDRLPRSEGDPACLPAVDTACPADGRCCPDGGRCHVGPLAAGQTCDSGADCIAAVCDEGFCRCSKQADCPDDGSVCAEPLSSMPGTGNVCRLSNGYCYYPYACGCPDGDYDPMDYSCDHEFPNETPYMFVCSFDTLEIGP